MTNLYVPNPASQIEWLVAHGHQVEFFRYCNASHQLIITRIDGDTFNTQYPSQKMARKVLRSKFISCYYDEVK